jgi:hypothetical protein
MGEGLKCAFAGAKATRKPTAEASTEQSDLDYGEFSIFVEEQIQGVIDGDLTIDEAVAAILQKR